MKARPAAADRGGRRKRQPAAGAVEELAGRLAPLQKTGPARVAGRVVRQRLAFVKRSLDTALARLGQASPRDRETPAAEWLLDNVHLLAAALEQVREDLPRSFYAQLPRLDRPRWRGEARVYALARALVEDGRGQFDPELARRFLRALAPPTALGIGELWALPAMLRLSLLEGLAAGAVRLVGLESVRRAGAARLWREPPVPAAPDRVGIYIQSLRAISVLDWSEFVESVSVVERILSAEVEGLYRRMDAGTRDAYRKAVELISRRSGVPEEGVARAAVDLARGRRRARHHPRLGHVGYYLFDAGRADLYRALGMRPPHWPRRFTSAHRIGAYLGAIALLTAVAWVALAAPVLLWGTGWEIAVAAVLGLVPASAVGVALVNWLVSQVIPPRVLAKLDYGEGVPEADRTAVLVPALLTDEQDIQQLLRGLELNYQGNADANIEFVLLADPGDADSAELPGDAALVAAAETGIRRLNERYGTSAVQPFWLFTRPRRWNPAQGCWMGWERKRGKIREFNALVLGRKSELEQRVGRGEATERFRYALVLDADTFLPQGVAARLVGTLAHPLNRAELDESGRVVAGYTVLQPRVEILPPPAGETPFARFMETDRGLDLYSGASSDVYQDLFDEGNFAGKGLLDIAAFERTLEGRIPENALLSHDLFEGVHGRAALVSDAVLYEDFPGHVLSYMRRLHRWVRGDWQIAPWLLPRVPGEAGPLRNRLSLLARWKIFDNLRRSVYSASLVALLLAGWLLFPETPFHWLLAALVLIAMPVLLGAATEGRAWIHGRRRGEVALRAPVLGRSSAARIGLALLLLPYQAGVETDAIMRTLARLLVTHRNLLVWRAAAQTARAIRTQRRTLSLWRAMAVAPATAAAGAVLIALVHPTALAAAAPLLAAWLLSPAAAVRLSRPPRHHHRASPADVRLIRSIARRTWGFFEQFAGPEDHWLPPDNFQEGEPGTIAHRTSPTNAGLLALSALSAYDLGYVAVTGLTATTENLLDTLEALERYRGHLLNWYDTRTLEPLRPRYVSTVDSGNLAACLLALAVGCEEVTAQPLVRPAAALGLADGLTVLRDQLRRLRRVDAPLVEALLSDLASLAERARSVADAADWAALLQDVTGQALPALERTVVEVVEAHGRAIPDQVLGQLRTWVDLVAAQADAQRREIDVLLPWLFLPAPVVAGPDDGGWLGGWRDLVAATRDVSLESAPAAYDRLLALMGELPERAVGAWAEWAELMRERLDLGRQVAGLVTEELRSSAARARALANGMDFDFLYDPGRHLFRIGYDVSAGRPDGNYYDLLASEARLASLVAIAKRDAPSGHWLHLGRPFALREGAPALLSWGGSMFEYLLPALLTRTPRRSLLGLGCRSAVAAQIEFGHRHRIPWGVSESAYADVDAAGTYQYRAFGVPALALRAHPADRVVIAGYASMLALTWAPRPAAQNVRRLCAQGMLGSFGLLEAMDYGPAHTTDFRNPTLIRCYMAHHQGMALAAAANLVSAHAHVRRFHRSPSISAVSYLLWENVPRRVRPEPLSAPRAATRVRVAPHAVESWSVPRAGAIPEAILLANGELSSLLTDRGDGMLGYAGAAVTRWDPDSALERHGPWLYLQDVESGALWAATSSPGIAEPEDYDVIFGPHAAEFHRRHQGISSRLAVAVAPDRPVELRRLALANETRRARRVRVVSYGEVVLGRAAEDRRHPAFSKLFVEAAFHPEIAALVYHRRTAVEEAEPMFLAHGALPGRARLAGWTTDRARFLGRNGGPRRPAALAGSSGGVALGGGPIGASLDPIFALAYDVELRPGESAELAYLSAIGHSERDALAALDAYRTWTRVQKGFEGARTRAESELARLGVAPADVHALQALLSALACPFLGHPHRVAGPPAAGDIASQRALWSLGISGDLPVVLVRVPTGESARPFVELVVRGHAWWRRNGFRSDLLLLDQDTGYAPPLAEWLHRLVAATGGAAWGNVPGGIFHVSAGRMDANGWSAVEAGASLVLDAVGQPLLEQVRARRAPVPRLPAFVPMPSAPLSTEPTPPIRPAEGLLFDNGFGGFSPDGREYVVRLPACAATPAPWINVIANPEFGFTVSEAGAGFTWSGHSGEHRLTAWTNDPVSDAPAEALYIRDEETAEVWSPTPRPAPAGAPYEVRHGAGYTRFRHASHGLEQEVLFFAARRDPVKLVRISLENVWDRQRRLTLTYYARWVLGPRPGPALLNVATSLAPEAGAILAWQAFLDAPSYPVAFLASSLPVHGATGDRAEFVGTPGELAAPAGLVRIGLAGTFGRGVDPCGALQVHVDLAPGASTTLWFLLGEGTERSHALALVGQYRDPARAEEALREVSGFWEELLGRVQVHTPEPSLDLLLGRWLPYQVLSCRVWGRSGLYQSSGAFGFRDQLQDVLALLPLAPELARDHILESAARQFAEGDVLHWWQPHTTLGLRSRCSDDLLWLPYVVAAYVEATGDEALLDASIPYLTGEPLAGGEVERYRDYARAPGGGTVYEHCLRALARGTTAGPHGLPLMGCGDWNDGMNLVGPRGTGESVWLAWFFCAVAARFAPICEHRGNADTARRLRTAADGARAAAEAAGWDGAWYRRAYFDDGTPLGSAASTEARIDSIAQTWAVLSGAAEPARARAALEAAVRELVREDDRLVLLLAPPFDRSVPSPGYIRAYPPGIRENGGQYTHAATWLGWAFAALGDGDRAEWVFRMLDPIRHAATRADAEHYAVEPYVLAGDVCGTPPHTGRGGWTWYTGSAAWLYRLGLEAILGLRRRGGRLAAEPCLPSAWPGFEAALRQDDGTVLTVRVRREGGRVVVRAEGPEVAEDRPIETAPALG